MRAAFALLLILLTFGGAASPAEGLAKGICSVSLPQLPAGEQEQIKNTVTIGSQGQWIWNGSPVKKRKIPDFLSIVSKYNPAPMMILSWQQGANCADVEAAEKMFRDSGVCEKGGCASEGAVQKMPEREILPTWQPAPIITPQAQKLANEIWKNSVPQSGQSLTVEGELLRAVEKLRHEAHDNGNGNRDAGHQILIDYLEKTLASEAIFSDNQKRRIKQIAADLRPDDEVELDDEPYDYLTARIMELYVAKGSQSRSINPLLKR